MCRPRIAISNRSRAISVRMPVVSRYSPTERASHSAALAAVHGASSGHLLRQPVDLPLRPGDGGDRQRADLRDQALVRAGAAAADEQVLAGHVGLVGGHAHLGRQRVGGVVLGRQPAAAAVDGDAALALLGPDASADSVPRLEHRDGLAGLGQPAGRGEPGVARSDDADVGLDPFRHRGDGSPVVGAAVSG